MTTDDRSSDFRVFSIDGVDNYFVKWCAAIFIFVAIGLVAIYKGQFSRIIFIVAWSGLWATFIAGTYYALTTADVLIESAQITRRVRGWISQRISWGDVRLIRAYSAYIPADREIRQFIQIFSRKPSFWKFQVSGPMLISDKVECFDELLTVLNEQISTNLIKVEVKVNGVWERRQRLVAILEMKRYTTGN
jgi:hypothetical protein